MGPGSSATTWKAGRPNTVVQEDATALAIWALLTYVKAAGDDTLVEVAREPIERATAYTVECTLNSYLYLVETTSSIHESDVSHGYEIWNNCAHAAAFALCHRVYGGERYRRLALMIRRAIGLLMVQDNRFLRRLDPHGYADPRPDVTHDGTVLLRALVADRARGAELGRGDRAVALERRDRRLHSVPAVLAGRAARAAGTVPALHGLDGAVPLRHREPGPGRGDHALALRQLRRGPDSRRPSSRPPRSDGSPPSFG